ncbi:MAG: hypothetical protein ACRCXD_09995 [Luteolibacter sp.]
MKIATVRSQLLMGWEFVEEEAGGDGGYRFTNLLGDGVFDGCGVLLSQSESHALTRSSIRASVSSSARPSRLMKWLKSVVPSP